MDEKEFEKSKIAHFQYVARRIIDHFADKHCKYIRINKENRKIQGINIQSLGKENIDDYPISSPETVMELAKFMQSEGGEPDNWLPLTEDEEIEEE